MTHICISNLIVIGSDDGLSPDRRQAIISINAGILLIGPLGTNFSEISIKIITFSFKKMRSKVSSVKQRPSCLGLNVLTHMITQVQGHMLSQWWHRWVPVYEQCLLISFVRNSPSVCHCIDDELHNMFTFGFINNPNTYLFVNIYFLKNIWIFQIFIR